MSESIKERDFSRENGNHTFEVVLKLSNVSERQLDTLDKILSWLEENGVSIKVKYQND